MSESEQVLVVVGFDLDPKALPPLGGTIRYRDLPADVREENEWKAAHNDRYGRAGGRYWEHYCNLEISRLAYLVDDTLRHARRVSLGGLP